MPVYAVDRDYVNEKDKPFARQSCLLSLDERSGLLGGDYYVGYDPLRVRGVRGAEGDAREISAYMI